MTCPAKSHARKRCRVLHLSLGLRVGGMERLLVEFAQHTDRNLFDLCFVSLTNRGDLAEAIESRGARVVTLNKQEGVQWKLVPRLVRLFRSWKPDVVHIHSTPALFYAAPAAKISRVPKILMTRHGRGSLSQPNQKPRKFRFQWFRLLSNLVDHIICVSEDAAYKTREELRHTHICTIPNGVDVSRFPYFGPQPLGPVVSVARLSPEKSLDTVLYAGAELRKKLSNFGIEFVGDGVCRESLETLSHKLGLANHTCFRGNCDNVSEILSRASVFVLPSVTEGMPLTVLEAMASGLPVVATRVGGIPELVVDGETGYLVDPKSPEQLVNKLEALLKDPFHAKAMGAAGRQRIEKHFTINSMVTNYERFYLNPPATG